MDNLSRVEAGTLLIDLLTREGKSYAAAQFRDWLTLAQKFIHRKHRRQGALTKPFTNIPGARGMICIEFRRWADRHTHSKRVDTIIKSYYRCEPAMRRGMPEAEKAFAQIESYPRFERCLAERFDARFFRTKRSQTEL